MRPGGGRQRAFSSHGSRGGKKTYLETDSSSFKLGGREHGFVIGTHMVSLPGRSIVPPSVRPSGVTSVLHSTVQLCAFLEKSENQRSSLLLPQSSGRFVEGEGGGSQALRRNARNKEGEEKKRKKRCMLFFPETRKKKVLFLLLSYTHRSESPFAAEADVDQIDYTYRASRSDLLEGSDKS